MTTGRPASRSSSFGQPRRGGTNTHGVQIPPGRGYTGSTGGLFVVFGFVGRTRGAAAPFRLAGLHDQIVGRHPEPPPVLPRIPTPSGQHQLDDPRRQLAGLQIDRAAGLLTGGAGYGGEFISFATFCKSVTTWSNSASVLPGHSDKQSRSACCSSSAARCICVTSVATRSDRA